MGQAIQQGGGHLGVAEDGGPFGEGEIGGDDDGGPLVEATDQVEEQLGLMNMMLHDVEGDLQLGDALSEQGTRLQRADLILTNPPFGTKKGGGLPSRNDFT